MKQLLDEEEYLQKCLRDYTNDKFEIEQVLFLFSYLIKHDLARKLTNQIRTTAQRFINLDWINADGVIKIELDEAREQSRQAQEEVEAEDREARRN
jgi:hypothetical protein